MTKRIPGLLAWAAVAALALAGCGGGGGDVTVGGGTGGTGIVSTGVMVKGSVIVNGVRFEDTLANIVVDDTPKSPTDLRDGMVVRVNGRVNDDGINGTAERVEAQIEVRGFDFEVLDRLAQEVRSAIESVPGITDVRLGREGSVPQQLLHVLWVSSA